MSAVFIYLVTDLMNTIGCITLKLDESQPHGRVVDALVVIVTCCH